MLPHFPCLLRGTGTGESAYPARSWRRGAHLESFGELLQGSCKAQSQRFPCLPMIGELLQGMARQRMQGELIRGTPSFRPSNKGETEQGSPSGAEVSTYLLICTNLVKLCSTVHFTAVCAHPRPYPMPRRVSKGSGYIPVEAHLPPRKVPVKAHQCPCHAVPNPVQPHLWPRRQAPCARLPWAARSP